MLITTYICFLTTLYGKHQNLFLLEAKRVSVPCFDINQSVTVSLTALNQAAVHKSPCTTDVFNSKPNGSISTIVLHREQYHLKS